ncbi:F-box protein SKIP23-like isoform X1 [Pistacia vera]|uniref:F-box protein SKIP23-like isoform X1 n=1 Tax=Pistacia vera TaxID=55513 RepID=UPI0012631C97|nr:F-box protein SKIP23-like isoform X1 [Pistacia vera]
MDTTTPDWTSLPDHLLASIAGHLPTRIDNLRCRAVCKSSRSSIPSPPKPLSPHANLKISMPSLPVPGCRGHLVLAEFTFYAIKPLPSIFNPHQTTYTWLVKSEELHSGKVRLEDPLSRSRLGNLSNKVLECEKLPQSLYLLNYRVKEVAKSYRLEQVYQGKGIKRRKPVVFGKAVASCHDEKDDGFAVMTIIKGMVLVWRNVDKKWTRIDMDHAYFHDIIYHNEKFFAVMFHGITVTVDSKSLTVSQVAGPQQLHRFWVWPYLIKSSLDLFMIMQSWHRRNQQFEFKVYKFDEEKREWVEVMDGLDDSVFFVGDDDSFSLSAKEFPGCKGNCVYFKEADPFKVSDCHPGTDGWIFDLKDGTVGGLSAFPGYSNIFRPRPTWVE